MTQIEAVQQWRNEAKNAWYIALDNLRLGHRAVFLVYAHLSLEKALKACFIAKNDADPPKTHNLLELSKLVDFVWDERELTAFKRITPYAVEARYDSGSLFMKQTVSDENIESITQDILLLLVKLSINIL